MAVCNLFNNLTSDSGNFMLFSQYVEDITHNYADGDNYKVVPSKFVALNINYSTLKTKGYDTETDLNKVVPRFFQNCFENACAYGREHYSDFCTSSLYLSGSHPWDSTISRNLFWNLLKQEGLITERNYNSANGNFKYIHEIAYYGDVSMHSYNEHQGMGYNELYCYIPTDAPYMSCPISLINDDVSYDEGNNSAYLEGYTDKLIGDYPQRYYYKSDFKLGFENSDLENIPARTDSKYNINTIVVLYDVLEKNNDTWSSIYDCPIPMGMYIAGKFDNTSNLSNVITKHTNTAFSHDTGTAYGLRICTRFTATPNNAILTNSEIIADDTNYVNISQLMTGMNENLSRMREISKMSYDAASQHAELLNIFRNSKTNVPYIKTINGYDCWFVNGKLISVVSHTYATDTDITNLFPEEDQP